MIGQAVADAQGNWTFTPQPPLANGTTVEATVTIAGLSSAAASTVIDSVAPTAPTIATSNGAQLSGTAEAGATLILTGSGGISIGQATADANGNWTFTPTPALADGLVVTAVARDAAGNTSGPVATTVDAQAPATPTIDASNGLQLGGTAEAGVSIVVTDAGGRVIGQTTAAADGTWALTPSPALANGTLVSAAARDALGNTSASVNTTIDTVAPVTPTISPSNGVELSGTAEAGSTVLITGPGAR
ncbi:Ig-like domain-containing protein [Pseudomonas sp. OHS18]|uniref:Ig-like domain-containing protein n=1 Tax=Pseudomonas sp. OHS18 TaxID=3399679 RepID=UPI003A8C589E